MKTTFFALMAFAGALMGETSSVVVSFDTNSAKMSSVNTKQLIRAGNSAITGITAMPFVSVGPDSWSFYPYGTNLFTALDDGLSHSFQAGGNNKCRRGWKVYHSSRQLRILFLGPCRKHKHMGISCVRKRLP